jgi:hypothetical protein
MWHHFLVSENRQVNISSQKILNKARITIWWPYSPLARNEEQVSRHCKKKTKKNFELFCPEEMAMSSASILDILECPVCLNTPSATPIFQCVSNGHVVCKDCVCKLGTTCPVCRFGLHLEWGLPCYHHSIVVFPKIFTEVLRLDC